MRALSLHGAELAVLSAEVLDRGGAFRFRARGASMAPWIRDGDLLTVQPTEAAALRLGDVALYRLREDRLAAHRIVGRWVEGERLVLRARGDASTGPVEKVGPDQVLGYVVRVQRGARTLDLDRRILRRAAQLWVVTAPVGPLLIQGLGRLKRLAGSLLRRLQGWGLYRLVARTLIGNKVRYRCATTGDAPALATLYGYGRMPDIEDPVGTWVEQLASLEGCGCAPIASLGGRIVGATVIQHCAEDRGPGSDRWIWGMRVDARYRGAGIGQGLVLRALEAAREEGAGAVYLRVAEENPAATGLYRKVGFRPAPATDDGPDRFVGSGGILWVYRSLDL